MSTLAAQLQAPDKNQRVAAALTLGKSGDLAALPILLAALSAELDDNVRETLTWAIVRFGDDAIQPLAQMLTDCDAVIRHQATHVLGKIGSQNTVPHLIMALGDVDSTVQMKAAFSLGQTGDRRAILALVQLLGHRNNTLQSMINTALEQFGRAAIDLLAEALQHPHWQARKQAAEVLDLIGDPKAITVLANALNDENNEVRFAAISALYNIGGPHAFGIMRSALNDNDERVKMIARRATPQVPQNVR